MRKEFDASSGVKYCPAGEHYVSLKRFRRSVKEYLGPEMSGYYIAHCKACESDFAKIRQHLRTGYAVNLESISKATFDKIKKKHKSLQLDKINLRLKK